MQPLNIDFDTEEEAILDLVWAEMAKHPDADLIAARQQVLDAVRGGSDYQVAQRYANTLDDALAAVDTAKRQKAGPAVIAHAEETLAALRQHKPA